MAKKRAGATPVARRQAILNADATREGVGNGNGSRRTRRRRDSSATKGPTQQIRERSRRKRRMRRRGGRKEKIVRDAKRATKFQEILQRSDGAKRNVVAGKRRKPPDDNGRTQMIRPISLTETRREKAHTIGVNNHERRTATKRSQFRRTPRRSHGEKECDLALSCDEVEGKGR